VSALPTRVRRPESIPPLDVLWFVLICAIALAAVARLVISHYGDMGDEREYGRTQ
jgi:hypothetical protein